MGGFTEGSEGRSADTHSGSDRSDGKVSTVATRSKEREIAREETDERFDTRGVIKTLEGLMHGVTKEKCTPETVNAACNCADKITQLIRVHLEVEKIRRKLG